MHGFSGVNIDFILIILFYVLKVYVPIQQLCLLHRNHYIKSYAN